MDVPTADLAIRGGIVVDSSRIHRRDVLITKEKVTALVPEDSPYSATRTIDASGKFVLPGIVDVHHHPVYADRIDTLSVAAARGGTTTVVGFVGAVKAWGGSGSLVDAVQTWIDEASARSVIDFSAHGSLMQDDLEVLEESISRLVEAGVTSFKGFMAYKKRGMKLEDDDLLRALTVISSCGGLFQVHAENGALIDYLQDRLVAAGKTAPQYYAESAPNLAEAEAVFRIATLAAAARCPLYLVHLSARESIDVVRLWRRWGSWPIRTETCTHYLTLTNADVLKRGTLGKVGPPLREHADQEALWEAIADGTIEVVATDFAGQTVESKKPLNENVFASPSGLPGIGELLTLVHDSGVNTGRITMPKLVEVLCANPARIFGMYPQKGALLPGSDADVVVFDPARRHVIRAAGQGLKTDYSMWEERECLGYPTLVIQRGRILVENGELRAHPGQGVFIPRERYSTVTEKGVVA